MKIGPIEAIKLLGEIREVEKELTEAGLMPKLQSLLHVLEAELVTPKAQALIQKLRKITQDTK